MTLTAAPKPVAADQVSYQDLYERWEQGNWSAAAIDFATDREQWRSQFTELERRAIDVLRSEPALYSEMVRKLGQELERQLHGVDQGADPSVSSNHRYP